jgi:hypothetical protein
MAHFVVRLPFTKCCIRGFNGQRIYLLPLLFSNKCAALTAAFLDQADLAN